MNQPFVPATRLAAHDDELPSWWLFIIYGSVFLGGIGSWIIVLVSSILYYVWRRDYPRKAAQINRHGWISFFLGNLLWLAILSAARHIAR